MRPAEPCELGDLALEPCQPARYLVVLELLDDDLPLASVWCAPCTAELRSYFHRDPRLRMVASL